MPGRLPSASAAAIAALGASRPFAALRIASYRREGLPLRDQLLKQDLLGSRGRAQVWLASTTSVRFYARPRWRTPEFATTIKSPIKPQTDNDLFNDNEVIYATPDGGKARVVKTPEGPKLEFEYPKGTPMLQPGIPWSNHVRYLSARYQVMLRSPATLVFQAVNGPARTLNTTRNEMAMHGLSLTIIDNEVFRMTVKETRYAGLGELLGGRCAVAYWDPDFETRGPTPDEGFEAYEQHRRNNPPTEASLMKQILQFTKNNPRLTLLGGRVTWALLTATDVIRISELPAVEIIRAELLGTVEMPARLVTGTLSQPSQALAQALDTYTSNSDE